MIGSLAFLDRYRDEQACIEALAALRWPDGFICKDCSGRHGYQLRARPRVWECADCGHQHSVTAGTVFHRSRTPLRKWFLAAHLLVGDNGTSIVLLARELDLRYATAWLIGQKLRQVLHENPEFGLAKLLEIKESLAWRSLNFHRGMRKPRRPLPDLHMPTAC